MDSEVKLAVFEEQIKGLREQHKAQSEKTEEMLKDHATSTENKLNKLFEYIKPISEYVTLNKELPTKVNTLWDERNSQKGVVSLGKFMAGGLGGLVVAAFEYMRH